MLQVIVYHNYNFFRETCLQTILDWLCTALTMQKTPLSPKKKYTENTKEVSILPKSAGYGSEKLFPIGQGLQPPIGMLGQITTGSEPKFALKEQQQSQQGMSDACFRPLDLTSFRFSSLDCQQSRGFFALKTQFFCPVFSEPQ